MKPLLIPILCVFCGILTACSPAAKILGVSVPATAKEIQTEEKMGIFGGNAYLSAKIDYSEYIALAAKLKMRNRPDLLEYWPSALSAHGVSWWSVSSTNDKDTFFSDTEKSTYLVMRYENGLFFFKRHVY